MSKFKILGVFFGIIAVCAIFLFVERYTYRKNWEKETSPLSQETIEILCANLSMNPQQSLCNGKKDVYALDFEESLREYFRPTDDFENNKVNTATYQEVEKAIGEFKTKCQPVVHETNPEFNYFRCFYDLKGDGYYVSAFGFTYPDEILFTIRSGKPGKD